MRSTTFQNLQQTNDKIPSSPLLPTSRYSGTTYCLRADSYISTLSGWQTEDDGLVTKGWEVVDGTLHLRIDGERGGNILATQLFCDYELQFE